MLNWKKTYNGTHMGHDRFQNVYKETKKQVKVYYLVSIRDTLAFPESINHNLYARCMNAVTSIMFEIME